MSANTSKKDSEKGIHHNRYKFYSISYFPGVPVPKTRKIISGVLTIILLLTLLIIDNYLPVGLTGTKAANLLTFFMSACMFGGSDTQTPQLCRLGFIGLHVIIKIMIMQI